MTDLAVAPAPLDPPTITELRPDLAAIAAMVPEGARVLDVGCGDGALLHHLWRYRGADARGIEIRPDKVQACVARGLSVVHGNANTDLADYPADAFDVAILSQTLQAMADPRETLWQLVRIGRCAIVSLPNFGYWRMRLGLLVSGRMPATNELPHSWWETPNIHLCTIRDFVELVHDLDLVIDRSLVGSGSRDLTPSRPTGWVNWTAEMGLFLVRRR